MEELNSRPDPSQNYGNEKIFRPGFWRYLNFVFLSYQEIPTISKILVEYIYDLCFDYSDQIKKKT